MSGSVSVIDLLLSRVGSLGSWLDRPIEQVVVLETLSDKQVSEELSEVRVVGLVVESKRSAVVEVNGKLVGETSAQALGGGCHFWDISRGFRGKGKTIGEPTLLHDSVVLLLLGSSLETLPWKLTSEEVLIVSSQFQYAQIGIAYHENVTERLQIISSRLLDTQMSVDGRVPSGTGQILVLSVRDMKMRLRVSIFLGQSEINDIDLVSSFSYAHEEIVGFDVSMNKVSRVDVFDSRNELVGEEKHRLEGELSVTKVEQVFE